MGGWRCLPGKPYQSVNGINDNVKFRYDIISLDEKDGAREDMEGVDWAVNYLHSLVIYFPETLCKKYCDPAVSNSILR